jgi:hypothetical protein
MRVDIKDSHWIADIAYMPQSIFDRLPTLTYEGMKIIHPNFQRIDQHRALSVPYENPPNEVIFHRWEKDIKRFNILDKYYPVSMPKTAMLPEKQIKIEESHRDFVLHGTAAYACMMKCLIDLVDEVKKQKGKSHPVMPKDIHDNVMSDDFAFNTEKTENMLTIIHHTPTSVITPIGASRTCYNPYMTLSDKIVINGAAMPYGICIYDSSNVLVSMSVLKIQNKRIRFTSVQHQMMYFMAMSLKNEGKLADYYMTYYVSCLNIIKYAEDLIVWLRENTKISADVINDIINNSPFFLTVRVYGIRNYNLAYEVLKNGADLAVGKIVVPIKTPKNYHPSNSDDVPKFNYAEAPLYQKEEHVITCDE